MGDGCTQVVKMNGYNDTCSALVANLSPAITTVQQLGFVEEVLFISSLGGGCHLGTIADMSVSRRRNQMAKMQETSYAEQYLCIACCLHLCHSWSRKIVSVIVPRCQVLSITRW